MFHGFEKAACSLMTQMTLCFRSPRFLSVARARPCLCTRCLGTCEGSLRLLIERLVCCTIAALYSQGLCFCRLELPSIFWYQLFHSDLAVLLANPALRFSDVARSESLAGPRQPAAVVESIGTVPQLQLSKNS